MFLQVSLVLAHQRTDSSAAIAGLKLPAYVPSMCRIVQGFDLHNSELVPGTKPLCVQAESIHDIWRQASWNIW